jgi:hypothetical protein
MARPRAQFRSAAFTVTVARATTREDCLSTGTGRPRPAHCGRTQGWLYRTEASLAARSGRAMSTQVP